MFKTIVTAIIVSAAALCFGADSLTTPLDAPASPADISTASQAPVASPAPAQVMAQPGVQIHGWGWLTMGRAEKSTMSKGEGYDINMEKEWLTDYDAGLRVVVPMQNGWKARLHMSMGTFYYVPDGEKRDLEAWRRRFVPSLLDAAMDKTFKFDNSQLYIEGGFFPVKTNPQAMNLGEYLFRSGTYPPVIYSGFEVADKFKIVGFHGSYKYCPSPDAFYKADAYFFSGFNDVPVHDWSPALILTARPHKFVEAGLGFDYEHMIVVDEKKNTPFFDENYNTANNKRTIERNLVAWVDSSSDKNLQDTIIYQFKGIKAMGRITFDPKALFPELAASIGMGSEDLKIYGEAAILGMKNYPGWYKNIEERMPRMCGINVPTFKIFDTLAFETEYYPYKYINSYENVWKYGSPVPYLGDVNPTYENRGRVEEGGWFDKTDDDWRFSLYFSKKLFKMVRISGQVATDHTMRTPYLYSPIGATKYTEICENTTEWYWMTRVMFYF